MAIPTVITDLSATIASNAPAGGDQAFPNIDDYLRAAYGFIRQGDTKASDIASAATVDLGAAVGRIVDVTGTTTITSFGTVAAGIWRIVRFTGALTLTHNATSLILPGAANITTAAGDCLVAVSLGSGNWVVTHFQRKSGLPVGSEVPSQTGNSGKYLTTNGTAVSWGDVIASGTWTPTYTGVSNVSSITGAGDGIYIRVGSVVHVSGSVSVDPTSTGITSFRLTLPVSSNFANTYDAAGTVGGTTDSIGGAMYADATNDALFCVYSTQTIGSGVIRFTGSYRIL